MKKWYQSKIIITNLISSLLGVIPLINEDLLTAVGILDVKGYLSILGVATTILNLLFRAISSGKVISSKELTE